MLIEFIKNYSRAGQEEMRQNPTSNPPYSFTLTTEQCMIIHGSILIMLFLVALARYLRIHFSLRTIDFISLKKNWILFSRSIGFFEMAVRASQTLHSSMFNGLILATMRFFDTNPSGRILNRFSKDIG